MTDCMVDLETYAQTPDAAIMTIGAIKFDRSETLPSLQHCDTFYRRVTLKSNKLMGRCIDENTLEWWGRQSENARYEVETSSDRVSLSTALSDFVEWFGIKKCVWSHGSTFDCIIIENAMKSCGIQCPWRFWDIRDTRTLFDIAGVRLSRVNNHHALYDCYNQIEALKRSLTRLNRIVGYQSSFTDY